MAGYDEYSKSNNALDAESKGRFPLTKAVVVVSKATGVSRNEARRILEELGSCEYHHTSKFYNVVYYYDTTAAINLIKYGTEESPEEIADIEMFSRKVEELNKQRSVCCHEWTGKSYHWYCPLCGTHDYKWEKP